MDGGGGTGLISVKGSLFRHPVAIAVGAAVITAVIGLNLVAYVVGSDAPWLLGAVLIADMLLIGVGILVAAREVLMAEERTQTSVAQLESIVDSAMDAIVTVDQAQKIVLFNGAAERVFRCPRDQAMGTSLERFLPERYRAAHHAHIDKFSKTGVTSRRMGDVTTLWGRRADGEEFPLEASISQTSVGGDKLFTVILRDISLRVASEKESERARHALTEAQARLAAIVDSAMDAVITVDEQQKVVLFNRTAEQLFQLPRAEAIGLPLDQFIPARFRGGHRGHVEKFGRTGTTSRRMGDVTTLWALRRDGSEFPIEASISQAVEEGRRFYTVILRDITLRKQAEEALMQQQRELRDLSARVLEAREEEKARIARELHDELGQLLTALKMDLASLQERLREAPLLEKAGQMAAMLDQTVSATRRISADLRPLMLDDLGLADAANWLVEDFSRRSGVRCEFTMSGEEALAELDPRLATAVYRAIQESLTNVARHSGAKNAWLALAVQDDELLYEIEDDGRGFSPDDLGKARSLGLKGMRERIAYFGGSLEVSRAPRGGARLRLNVPVKKAEEALAP